MTKGYSAVQAAKELVRRQRTAAETLTLLRTRSRSDRERIRKEEEGELERALLAWVNFQSGENSRRLYEAAVTHFGMKRVIPD